MREFKVAVLIVACVAGSMCLYRGIAGHWPWRVADAISRMRLAAKPKSPRELMYDKLAGGEALVLPNGFRMSAETVRMEGEHTLILGSKGRERGVVIVVEPASDGEDVMVGPHGAPLQGPGLRPPPASGSRQDAEDRILAREVRITVAGGKMAIEYSDVLMVSADGSSELRVGSMKMVTDCPREDDMFDVLSPTTQPRRAD